MKAKETMSGKAQTVAGPISANDLDIVLTHEHCLIDFSCMFNERKDASSKKIASEKLSFDNVGYVRYHVLENRDNLLMIDEEQAIRELTRFKRAGGGTVADMTNVDIGRDPLALARISRATGLNIIMGSGYYVKSSQDLAKMEDLTEEEIAKEIVQDIVSGVDQTGIKAGVIGEIGCSWPLEDCEKKVLRAAGLAQRETGAPLVIHPGRSEAAPMQIVRILKEVETDLTHTCISHIDRTLFDPADRFEVLNQGCYLAYDEWGSEGYYPESLAVVDLLNDAQRISQIKDFILKGYGSQILISHDICYKCRYMEFGGHGYAHIINNSVPAMRRRGMTEEEIADLLINNPKRFFVFK